MVGKRLRCVALHSLTTKSFLKNHPGRTKFYSHFKCMAFLQVPSFILRDWCLLVKFLVLELAKNAAHFKCSSIYKKRLLFPVCCSKLHLRRGTSLLRSNSILSGQGSSWDINGLTFRDLTSMLYNWNKNTQHAFIFNNTILTFYRFSVQYFYLFHRR